MQKGSWQAIYRFICKLFAMFWQFKRCDLMDEITAIVFDLGGVIIDYKGSQYYEYMHKKTGIKTKEIMKVMLPLIDRFEKGAIKKGEFERNAAKRLGISNGIDWVEEFKSCAKVNKDMLALVKRLKKSYKIGLLSNVDKARYAASLKIFDKDLFDVVIASCYLGIRKPSVSIYKYAAKKLGASPSSIFFTDDIEKNIEGARKAGWHAERFVSYDDILSKMRHYGIKV